MKHKAKELLNDVFGETAPDGWRGAMLGETLRHVRRRRRHRQLRHTAVALIVAGLLATWLRQAFVHTPSVPLMAGKSAPAGCEVVHTRPLLEKLVISTGASREVQIVTTTSTVRKTVTTGGDFRRINDEELLAFAATRPVILIGTGPKSEVLVFLNPEDRKGFPVP
jgi:hypothetical protein